MMVSSSQPQFFSRITPALLHGGRYRAAIARESLKKRQVRRLRRAVGRVMMTREAHSVKMRVAGEPWQVRLEYGDLRHARSWWTRCPLPR